MANLYLLEQDVNDDYDTYDSCVVVADSEQEAQQIHPSEFDSWGGGLSTWAYKPEQVRVKLIGVAADYLEVGTVICSSYNAG